ncbi:MAG: hypothetical protein IKB07_06555 [Lachnospiraceae bacterium]|nr:hypothetical protein [Lachnospiraceae bacterium]
MKRRIKICIMTALLLLGIAGSTEVGKTAEAATGFSNLEIGEGGSADVILVPGKVTEVTIPIEARQDFIYEAKFEAIVPEDAPFQVEGFDIYQQHLSLRFDDDYISTSSGTMLTFYILTKETAKIGEYEFDLRYEDRTWDGNIIREGDREYSQRITMTAKVEEEKMPAELAINNLKVTGTMKPGGEATVSFEVVNTGEIVAKGVRLSGDYSSGLLIPNYTEYTRKLGDLKQNQSAKVSLKIKVMENVAQSIVLLPLKITYKDIDGESFTADANNILYLNVQLPEEEKKEEVFEDGTLLINNVKQSPAKPKAGEKVTLTFDMENTGERDYTETKLYMDYVSNVGFEPVKAEPYQYVGTVKAGQKKSVSVTVIAGKEIPDGMNTLGVSYTYKNGKKEDVSGNVMLYVLNVQAIKEEVVVPSRPKLMVTDFTVNRDVVKAGEEFDFTFQVYNTHNETAAKNIKITVVSDQFSVTKGSNSFFVQKIAPGESEELVINLKASAAAMTGSYPINIEMEYEYDGMPASEANAGGISVTETKMLLVKENLRVSVENVMVGGWDMPYANQTTQLSFSVYNMGKSALNNVYFTVEGDFMVANGSSYYYGTLQAGYPDYVEMDIIPLVAGEAVGTLTIHMEDSNGDEETYITEISGFIMEMDGGNMGFEDPGMDWPTDLPTMGKPVEEKPMIVSLPVYIGILVVVFLLSLFVTRGIRLACYKKKLRREEE